MNGGRRDYSWLPDHQFHAALTLAHVDAIIEQVGAMLFDYLAPPGPLSLENVAHGELAHVTVTAVAPLPAAVARCAADALTQLRAAVEHTIFAEVEYQLGRSMNADEARRVEMPACTAASDFQGWLSGRRRPQLPPLASGSPLVGRIRDLQPYRRKDFNNHPMRLLTEHTNHAKHRTPAVAATQLALVRPDAPAENLMTASVTGEPVKAGDVLATSGRYERIPLSVWPKVAIQRPHTGEWNVLVKELGLIEEWVRTVAIPLLVTGTYEVDPLPPQVDLSRGFDDGRLALAGAGAVSASERFMQRLGAHHVRDNLPETLATVPGAPAIEAIQRWVASLDDNEVLAKQDRLTVPVQRRDVRGVDRAARELLAEVAAFLASEH